MLVCTVAVRSLSSIPRHGLRPPLRRQPCTSLRRESQADGLQGRRLCRAGGVVCWAACCWCRLSELLLMNGERDCRMCICLRCLHDGSCGLWRKEIYTLRAYAINSCCFNGIHFNLLP
ncbi:hypothetical protein VTK26DRAFT_1349 [Humicola hyalothermophila]